MSKNSVFEKLGLPTNPLLLAPLAGVSDHPFRRVCVEKGADLTYVEMISATALLYESRRTLEMLSRHPEEQCLGVQITAKSADELGRAVAILDRMPFDTIDINMGCPVKKVVKTGCGSAILKDPQRVYDSVRQAKNSTDKPVSAKIRIGWDRQNINALEVAEAIQSAGADWLVVHGRTRSDDYAVPVDLDMIARIKRSVSLPVIGNGNLFGRNDASYMLQKTGIDGLMISRGALGNPWVFRDIKDQHYQVDLDEWANLVHQHLSYQRDAYGDQPAAAVCMRKHLLWYAKGWDGAKALREAINAAVDLREAQQLIDSFVENLRSRQQLQRRDVGLLDQDGRFQWDPKWDMDRQLDRGLSDEATRFEAGLPL